MSLRPLSRLPWRTPLLLRRHYVSPNRPSTFHLTRTCPDPTCACSPMPEMPPDLPIDYTSTLHGKIPVYAEQVLVCTGRGDWGSNIYEEEGGVNLASELKAVLGRGGVYDDLYHNVAVLNASFPSSIAVGGKEEEKEKEKEKEKGNVSAYLFPSFRYVPFLPRGEGKAGAVDALVRGYLLPNKLHKGNDGLSAEVRDRLTRKHEARGELEGVRDVRDVVVLICGHGGRDARCGVLGPVLKGDFERMLEVHGLQVRDGPVEVDVEVGKKEKEPQIGQNATARVGLISHIGGHKFAGNVIIYIPAKMKMVDGKDHPLAGCGIWYGRVEPRHVDGIVRRTVRNGSVIEEFFRGGIRPNREIVTKLRNSAAAKHWST